MRVLSIDPGQQGAIAVVETGPRVVDVRKMPADMSALGRTIDHLVDTHLVDKCIIEQPLGAIGGKGAQGLATQHREWGILYAVCNERVSTSTVHPNTWIAGIKAATGRSAKHRRRAQVEKMSGTRVHIYQCDAPLIGFWALLQMGGLK